MNLPQRVEITEVGPRDGLQNEQRELTVEQKLELIRRLVDCNLTRIEAGSFVHPKWVPQMRGTDAVLRGLPRRAGVRYIALVPNVAGARLAVAERPDELAAVVSASETHNRRNLNRSIEETLVEIAGIASLAGEAGVSWTGYVSTAFGCPYEGDVPGGRVVELAGRLLELGAAQVALGDTTGMANPRQVDGVVRAFQSAHPGVPLRLHFHDTRGAGIANVLAALELGVTRFDASLGGLGGCPYAPGAGGNIATEDLVHTLHEMGIETGIDLKALIETAKFAEQLVGRELPGKVKVAGRREDLVAAHAGR